MRFDLYPKSRNVSGLESRGFKRRCGLVQTAPKFAATVSTFMTCPEPEEGCVSCEVKKEYKVMDESKMAKRLKLRTFIWV
ncbi:MAG: hypothetical protein Q7S14_00215 [bacterium]|nr:hypothetical protein [bacterium]